MVDCIILITCSNNQYEITKECLESIKSTKYKYKIYLLNHGQDDKLIRKLGEEVNHFKEFKFGTPITIEMNYGIEKALEESDLVMNINNDIVFHPKTLDMMISTMKEKDILSLCGHILTEKDELKNYDIKENYDLYYKGIFVSESKVKSWLPIIFEDFGFDLYSMNIWHRNYFERVGLPDEETFNQGIYFWDSDLQYRGVLAGIDTYVASSAIYYHFCGHTANTNPKAKERLDNMYVAMKIKYRDKFGGNLKNSKYIGSQHGEDFCFSYQDKLTSEELLKETIKRNKRNKKYIKR